MSFDEQDDRDAAEAQHQLEERRRWDAHFQALKDFQQWQQDMASDWERIEKETGHKSCKA